MKKRALNKDFRMEIKKSMNRFLSILLIVALGVAFFSGIQSAAPDMRATEDAYFDDSSLMDIRVISTLGLTDQDVKALKAVDGVADAEGSYMEDAFTGDGEIQEVLQVEAFPDSMNEVAVVEGSLPAKSGECFLDQYYADSRGLKPGDSLALTVSDEDSSILKRTSFTISGTGYSPCYIALSRGSTTLGTGSLEGFVYVLPEDFDSEAYTVIYLTVEDAKEQTAFTAGYDDLVAEVLERVEAIEDVRCEARYDEVTSDALSEIADAKQELEDGKKELEDAREELEEAKAQAESELAEAESELLEGESELEEGKQELADGQSEAEDGEAELAAGEAEISANESAIADAQAQLAAALETLQSGEADYQSGLAQYQSQESSARSQLADAQAAIDSGEAELAAGEAEYQAGLAEVEAGEEALSQAEAELEAGQSAYDEAKAELDAGQAAYDSSAAQVEAGQAAYDSAAAALESLRASALSAESTAADLLNSYNTAQAGADSLQAAYDAADAGAAQCAAELSDAQAALASLQADLDAAQNQQQASTEEASNYAGQIEELQGKISANENAIAAQQAIVNDENASEDEKKAAQDEISRLNGENDAYLSEISGLQAAMSAAQSAAAEAGNNAASLEGQVASQEGVVAERQAAADAASAGASELASELSEARSSAEGLKSAYDSANAAAQALRSQLDTAQSELDATKTQLDSAYAELSAAKSELDAGRAALAASAQQLDDGRAEIESNRAALKSARSTLSDSASQISSARSELRSAQREVDSGYAELDSARRQLSEARSQLDEGWAEYNAGQAELADGQSQLSEGRSQIESARQQLADAIAQLAEAEEEIAENEQKLQDGWDEYEDGKREADEEIADAEQEIEDGERELLDAEQEIADAEDALSELSYPSWYVNDRSILPDNTGYGENADRMSAIAQVFPVIFFLVAALISLTTMTRMVEEERTQIGTFKALGYGKFDIAKKYLKYAFWATVAGSIIGFILGEKLIPWIIIQAYGIMYLYSPAILVPFNWEYGIIAAGIALLCTIGATVYSCFRALMEVPAELMRPPAPKEGRRVWLEHLPFIWKHLSFSWKSSVRNLMRYKGRFFMTVFGIGGCMGLLLVGFGLRDSIMDVGLLQYNKLQTYSAMLIFDPDASQKERSELEEAVRNEDGVKNYKYFYMQKLDIDQQDLEGSGKQWSLYVYVPDDMENLDQYLLFRDRRTKEPLTLGDEGAVITEKIASEFGISVGDCIALSQEEGDSVEVPVAAICENYLSHYLYLTPALYEACFGEEPKSNSIFICSDEDEAAVEAIGTRLLACDAAVNITYTQSLIQELDDMLGALDLVILVLIVSAGLLAFVVLYNLNNININERQRELATIKVLGFYDSEVGAYVYRENIMLTVLGVAAGCLIGRLLHAFIITTVEVDSTMFGRTLYPQSYLYGILFTFAFSVIVNFVMYFKLKKIDMVESLKSIE